GASAPEWCNPLPLPPTETHPPYRQCIVDGIAVAAQKAHAGVPRRILNHGGRGLLAGVATRLRRQSPDETRRCPPIAGEFLAIGGENGGLARVRPRANPDPRCGATPPPRGLACPRLAAPGVRPPARSE